MMCSSLDDRRIKLPENPSMKKENDKDKVIRCEKNYFTWMMCEGWSGNRSSLL